MRVKLNDTSTSELLTTISDAHLKRGEPEHTRVLTLLISCRREDLEDALDIAKAASHEHPCRTIAVISDAPACDGPLCAELRIGSDAGAGEIIVLYPTGELKEHLDSLVIPLLVANAPVVCWWPVDAPENPAEDLLGMMANSRITDRQLSAHGKGNAGAQILRSYSQEEDIDLSWTRLTVWRGLLASLVDQPPHLPIERVRIEGAANYLPMSLMAAWLKSSLGDTVPVEQVFVDVSDRIAAIYLERADGTLSIERPAGDQTIISRPGTAPQSISVHPRTRKECLIEELRRLDTDVIYRSVIEHV